MGRLAGISACGGKTTRLGRSTPLLHNSDQVDKSSDAMRRDATPSDDVILSHHQVIEPK